MATRPIISYDDITLPYEAVEEPTRNPSTSSNQPPAKKRRSNSQKAKQQQRQRHWDDPGNSGTISYDSQRGNGKGAKELETQYIVEEGSRELTHEEIWDDSALIEAWDSAMEEYQAYNGPDKGWKKEPVHKSPLRWYNVPPDNTANKPTALAGVNAQVPNETTSKVRAADQDSQPLNFDTFVPTHDPSLNQDDANHPEVDESFVPQDGVGVTVSRDEAFQHALNATYWAGYWTAMYYCQRRASQNRSADEADNVTEDNNEGGNEAADEEEEGEEEEEEEDGFVSTQR